MRRLAIFLLVLAVLGTGIDFAARAWAQGQIAEAVEARTELADVEVELEGFPFVLDAWRGQIDAARMSARGIERRGVRLERVELVLRRLTFDRDDLIDARTAAVQVHDGSGSAVMTEAALNRVLARRAVAARVDLEGDAVWVRPSTTGPAPAVPTDPVKDGISLQQGSLLIQVPGELPDIEVALPEVVDGVRYQSARIEAGKLLLRFLLRDADIEL